MSNLPLLLSLFVVLVGIYALTATGGIISERSGIVNLSLNGYLMIGALGSLMTHYWLGYGNDTTGSKFGNVGTDVVSLLGGMLFAMVASIPFSLGVINLKGNHVIVGTAINLLLVSLVFIVRFLDNNEQNFTTVGYSGSVLVESAAVDGFNYSSIIYLSIALVLVGIMWFTIRFTKFGMHLWASGENPNALAAAGISVYRVRWLTQFITAAFAGIAGAMFIIFSSWAYSSSFAGNVEGIGYIALAFIVLSQWRIHFLIPVAFAFAFLQSWLVVNKFDFQNKSPGFNYLMEIIPFGIPLVILPFFKKISNAPKHDGLIYDKSKR